MDLRSQDREPINLTAEDLQLGRAKVNGREVPFTADDIITGVVRVLDENTLQANPMGTGQIAMQVSDVNVLMGSAQDTGLSPELLSWFPFPASGPGGSRVVQYQRHFLALCEGVGRRPKRERDEV